MSIKDSLVRLAAFKLIAKRAAVLSDAEKATIKAEVGGRMGATAAILPDGSEAATVWITKPTRHKADPGGEPYVSNPALFVAFVEKVSPDAIVKSVRSTDLPRLLENAKRVMKETGERPPGLSLTDPAPASESGGGVVSIKMSDEQEANLLRALVTGAVQLPSFVAELEEGDDA